MSRGCDDATRDDVVASRCIVLKVVGMGIGVDGDGCSSAWKLCGRSVGVEEV